MPRTYTLKRRAESQAATRRRIVEAAIELHGTVGPARTTISMLAERAGVQRHTLYAHFPDEMSLLLACSKQHLEREPLPDADGWSAIDDRQERLRIGLRAIYGWYARNGELTGCVLRDAEYDPLTREIAGLSFGPPMARYEEVLGAGLTAKQAAMLHLAISFYTWRTLVTEAGLAQQEAVDMMVAAICAAA
jgi:AcrR family transcriptional regulator